MSMVLRGQIGHTPQHIELFVTEVTAIFIRVEDLVPLVGAAGRATDDRPD